jgi:hypothetical protein
MSVLACKPSTKPGRVILKPSIAISSKKQLLRESKDLSEKLKGKILKLT